VFFKIFGADPEQCRELALRQQFLVRNFARCVDKWHFIVNLSPVCDRQEVARCVRSDALQDQKKRSFPPFSLTLVRRCASTDR
jgi:hypothetical protein